MQCRPFHPCEQTHVPFLHWPCSWHRGSQGSSSQCEPVQPGSHLQRPESHTPWGPHSKPHNAENERIEILIKIRVLILSIYFFKSRLVTSTLFRSELKTERNILADHNDFLFKKTVRKFLQYLSRRYMKLKVILQLFFIIWIKYIWK